VRRTLASCIWRRKGGLFWLRLTPADMSQPRLRQTAPVFLVGDVAATMAWYASHLGFEGHPFPQTQPHAFAVLVRDQVEIMLQQRDGYEKPALYATRNGGVWDAYIRMTGVQSLYEQVSAQTGVTLLEPLCRQSYGDTEFVLQDLNGYVLVFSEQI
jgi:uncharacterized glyoxalase superfamily protein PhnB